MTDPTAIEVADLTDDQLLQLLRRAAQGPGPLRSNIKRALNFLASDEKARPARRDLTENNLSILRPQVGAKSADGSAILGRDGQLFLYKGNNNLVALYDPRRREEQLARATEWISLIRSRATTANKFGCEFFQVAIPDAPSSLPEKFPEPISGSSWMLSQIEAELSEDNFYLSAHNVLAEAGSWDCYRRTDTHLSAIGCWTITNALLNKLNLRIEKPDFCRSIFISGDLSLRFSGMPLYEEVKLPSPNFASGYQSEMEIAETFLSPSGQGKSRHVWRNPTAPFKMRVVVFGNSYFERGQTPMALSWWFARLFEEFHFCWESHLLTEYVESIKPDVVICQTVERFMWRVPAT